MFSGRKKTTFVNEFNMHTMDWGWILNIVSLDRYLIIVGTL
jgi:hypothetical protein